MTIEYRVAHSERFWIPPNVGSNLFHGLVLSAIDLFAVTGPSQVIREHEHEPGPGAPALLHHAS